jgi:hypothetical protein
MLKYLYVCICFFCSICSCAQSVSGIWKGQSEHSVLTLNPVATLLEVEVNQDSLISGVIHYYYKKNRYEHIKVSGIINWKDSTFEIIEEEEISSNINTKVYELCLGKMSLRLSKVDGSYHLEGKWKDKSKKLFRCPTLKISFDKPGKIITDTVYKNIVLARKTDVQKVIELTPEETDSIKCAIYDNGEIDNDTASVWFNDSLIVNRQRLSQVPFEFYISVDPSRPLQKLKLIADNLGSIPPNTALLVITTRSNRYMVTLSSDYSRTGSVEFFMKE